MATQVKRDNDFATKRLIRGLEIVKSIEYKPTTRYIFYRLWQEGFFSAWLDKYAKASEAKAKANHAWLAQQARARHTGYLGWELDTVVDDTRHIIEKAYGYYDHKNAISDLPRFLMEKVDFHIDHFWYQENYVALCFEAAAMVGQFEYYTKDIDLIPVGGDPSIEYKLRIAKHLERNYEIYRKPLIVLYFGDLDKKGEQIGETIEKHVKDWCKYPIEWQRCGLTLYQAGRYNLPDDPKRPGKYQWESLDDKDAKEIIMKGVKPYMIVSKAKTLNKDTAQLEDKWKPLIEKAIREVIGGRKIKK